MHSTNSIDSDVRAFVVDRIKSVEHLEILLLLFANANRSWTVEDVSQKLRNSPTSARSWLDDLAGQHLLQRSSDAGQTSYTYQAPPEGIADIVGKVAQAYGTRRVSVIDLIFSKPLDKIQVFADAFKIIQKKEDR